MPWRWLDCFVCPRRSSADNIAYDNAAGVAGLQMYGGSLGLDFTANSPLYVTQLGAFTNGNPALLNGDDGTSGITAQIYTSAGVPYGPSVNVNAGNPGAQVNGNAYLPLSSPVFVPAGFTGSIVVSNDPNYNTNGAANTNSTLDSSGVLSYTGGGRFGSAGSYPGNPDGGPANRYDAGTFQFQPNTIAFNNGTARRYRISATRWAWTFPSSTARGRSWSLRWARLTTATPPR